MNVFRVEGEVLVAACDEDIHGKSFEEGKLVLKVEEEFYGSDLMDWEGLFSLLKEATIANLAGREVVANAVEVGLIEGGNVLRVRGVPHAQVVRI